ncbi:hypothetical protein LTR86_002651 [Recurvomyces mirabilis]|nr:hypothetical protein LTR86_002651 [Recurvomyces mirabilis]
MGEIDPAHATPHAVSCLHRRVPALSSSDSQFVEDTIGSLFPRLEENQRDALLSRVLQCSRILSLETFFADIIYLEVCYSSLRVMLPAGRECVSKGVQSAFRRLYTSESSDFEHSYLKLGLYWMRHFPEMSDNKACQPRQQGKGNRYHKVRVHDGRTAAFLAYASSLGFDTSYAPSLVAEPSPDTEEASSSPPLSTDAADLPLNARCNRPYWHSYLSDRKYAFISHMTATRSAEKRRYVTSFAIAKDIVERFWPCGVIRNTSASTLEDGVESGEPIVSARDETGPSRLATTTTIIAQGLNSGRPSTSTPPPGIIITQPPNQTDALRSYEADGTSPFRELRPPLTSRLTSSPTPRSMLPLQGASTALVRRRDEVEDDLEARERALRPPSSIYSSQDVTGRTLNDEVTTALANLRQGGPRWAILGIATDIRYGSDGAELERILIHHSITVHRVFTTYQSERSSVDKRILRSCIPSLSQDTIKLAAYINDVSRTSTCYPFPRCKCYPVTFHGTYWRFAKEEDFGIQ